MKNMTFLSISLALVLTTLGLRASEAPEYGTRDDLLPGGAGMTVRGKLLFTTIGSEPLAKARRLVAVDIKDPAAPRVLSFIDLKGFPQDLAWVGDTAFVVDGLRLVAIDTSKPSAMRILSETAIADTPENGPQGIVIDGTDAYLACRKQGVVKVDVSRAEAPVVRTVVPTPFSRGVALYKSGEATYVVSADDTRGVHVIQGDRVVASHPLPKGCAARVRVVGNHAYVANGGAFLTILSLASNGSLTLVSECATLPDGIYYGSYAYDVLPVENYALLSAGENGVKPVDVSDPAHPIASAEGGKIPAAPLVRAAVLDNGRLYVNAGTMDGRTLLVVMDAATLPALKPIGEPLNLSE